MLEVKTGQIVAELEISPDLLGLAFSPNSQTLALLPSGNHSVSILIWDFLSGQTHRLSAGNTPHSLAWHPAGTLLAAGGLDGNLTLWVIAAGDVSHIWGQHSGDVTALTFCPDGRHRQL